MKKINLLFIVAVFLVGYGKFYSQAADRLYLSLQNTGRVYDITNLSGTIATPSALPGALGTPPIPGGAADNASNIAVGYDAPGGNPSNLVYIQSHLNANSALYKNGTAITPAVSLPNVSIAGIATNNVPGTFFGNVYGFQRDIKALYPIYPAGSRINITSTDQDWNNGTTFGTDTFFDYQNNIYMFVNRGGARYLFKISIETGVAVKAFPVAITGAASQANLPTASGIQGMAYLQGYVYIATVNDSPRTITVRRINMFDGTSIVAGNYSGGNYQNLDLATVPYYVPFQFNCAGITQSPNTPFVRGVASNGQKFINIPISNVYEDGTYIINVTGTNFTNPSYAANVTRTTTSIQVPLIYTGGGVAGTRTLTVNLNGSTTACTVNVLVDEDTDGDGIGNLEDMDDDNDGILDTVECGLVCENPFVNGGFEAPVVAGEGSFLNQNAAGLVWQTTATDSQIELWRSTNPAPAEGSQYAELNANQASTLYQTFCLNGTGATINWSVKHRGRAGVDVAAVKFGATIAAAQASTAVQNMSDGNTAWGSYSGTYNVPAGVTSFVIAFQAVSTSSGNQTIGNFIDDVQLTITQACLDTDGDGIIDSLDIDSDNDGCPDAIEGSENVFPSQLNAGRSINIANTGGVGSTPGVNLGVPNLVNSGGAADIGGTVGQGIGVSKDSTRSQCLDTRDTDGDGIANWQDLDSDNDGILDIVECPDYFVTVPFNNNANPSTPVNFSAPAADLGFIFDIYTLDNSFVLTVNGQALSITKLEFQPDQSDNVRFLDGSRYGNGGIPQIYEMTGTEDNPLVRIIIHKNGTVNMYGSKTGGGPLFPLQLFNGNAFNNVIWNATEANSVVLTQPIVGATYITGRGRGVKHGFCDQDGDNISSQYDVDSDGDGCPDAIEGSETVRFDQVHSMTLPSNNPNYPYRGQIKVAFNGTTTGTPAQIISNSNGANGVPQLVNFAGSNLNTGTNPLNLAGLVDNTDNTSDIGQGVGTSQNAAQRDVECERCFRPPTSPGSGGLSTSQGFTALARAGESATEWPGKIKGAYTALDAKTKGFVINRVPTASLSSIIGVAGMMVYDTTENCLKIYDGTTWSCFSKQTCNDFNQ